MTLDSRNTAQFCFMDQLMDQLTCLIQEHAYYGKFLCLSSHIRSLKSGPLNKDGAENGHLSSVTRVKLWSYKVKTVNIALRTLVICSVRDYYRKSGNCNLKCLEGKLSQYILGRFNGSSIKASRACLSNGSLCDPEDLSARSIWLQRNIYSVWT